MGQELNSCHLTEMAWNTQISIYGQKKITFSWKDLSIMFCQECNRSGLYAPNRDSMKHICSVIDCNISTLKTKYSAILDNFRAILNKKITIYMSTVDTKSTIYTCLSNKHIQMALVLINDTISWYWEFKSPHGNWHNFAN